MPAISALHNTALSGRFSIASKFGLLTLGAIGTCAVILFFFSVRQTTLPGESATAQSELRSEQRLDQRLYQTATTVLGSRDGTIIVMDPQSGRIRAVVNPELASERAFAPGSTIKAFTLLAALRRDTIRHQSRILCHEHYSHEEFETTCSHPKDLPPFGPAEAIAYSCNYYFGKVGEQLNVSAFNSTLAEFGFGERTGVDWLEGEQESVGRLAGAPWRSQNALGEGSQIQVTPLQLLTAYSALLNGGHLFKPHTAHAKDLVPQSRRDVRVDSSERSLIVQGMRGAVRYGTAERARLYSLPAYIFGKTGTSTKIDGFRTQGWFVGFASSGAESHHLSEEPKSVKLGVLVFLKRAHGADAALLARPIFEAFAQAGGREDAAKGGPGDAGTRRRGDAETRRHGDAETRGHGDAGTRRQGDPEMEEGNPPKPTPYLPVSESPRLRVSVSPRLRVPASEVRVHLVRENITRMMPLEDYVLGVVASEGSTEDELEALKALAVASRTYALKNERRHAGEGYDFCSTTHCQRYRFVNLATANAQPSLAILSAVKETTGEILQDSHGQIVDSYFGASCGGVTANIHKLWGTPAQDYLKGQGDEYCRTGPHHSWADVISSDDLLRALQSDSRTNVGDRLTNIRVVRQDATGRAELIALEGLSRRTVSGWDFKIIIGRVLGWNLLKSSRFEISRLGSKYVFRGSGFGHGLGLCQEGAHMMARRGVGYQQILTKYFPTTHVARKECKAAEDTTNPRVVASGSKRARDMFQADLLWSGAGDNERALANAHSYHGSRMTRRSLSSEHFRLNYPGAMSQRDAENVLRTLESSRGDLVRRVSASGVSLQFPALEIFINQTTGDFVGRTGQPPWAAAVTRGNRVELQPLDLLKRRRILETTLRHELVHAVIDTIGQGRTPRWLAEGLALHYAGEGPMMTPYLRKTDTPLTDLEQRLSRPASAEDMRAAYAAAYREVKRLIHAKGEAAVWLRVFNKS